MIAGETVGAMESSSSSEERTPTGKSFRGDGGDGSHDDSNDVSFASSTGTPTPSPPPDDQYEDDAASSAVASGRKSDGAIRYVRSLDGSGNDAAEEYQKRQHQVQVRQRQERAQCAPAPTSAPSAVQPQPQPQSSFASPESSGASSAALAPSGPTTVVRGGTAAPKQRGAGAMPAKDESIRIKTARAAAGAARAAVHPVASCHSDGPMPAFCVANPTGDDDDDGVCVIS